jgi:hypothetical protein
MEVCSECFNDDELKGFISSFEKKGNCKICGAKKSATIRLSELIDFFIELIDNFQISENGTPLNLKLTEEWDFFTSKVVANSILIKLLPSLDSDISSPNQKVGYVDSINENISYWEKLKRELRTEKRFLPDLETLIELQWDSFFETQYQLEHEAELYRARVHHESGMVAYEAEKMMCPPPTMANGGRANPLGIPFLYLSDNSKTVLYEVRASYLDELSVGKFKLKKEYESIKIVDFTEKSSLFRPDKVTETIKSRLLRHKISEDLSKPMRRYDTKLEYIPTQFICEFIKIYTGANGIRFRSSLHLKGNNIVIFDQELMECIAVEVKQIDTLNLTSKAI